MRTTTEREHGFSDRRGRVQVRRWRTGLIACVLTMAGSIGGGCKAEPPWPLWESYAARFIDGQGRVIDHSANDVTTTEGQAYAMFFALVANDRDRFDKLEEWTEANLAQGDLTIHLPAWSWGKAPDGSWRVLDGNSAADADLWMAYDLCEAGRLWHYERYEKLGALLAMKMAQQEVVLVPGVGTTLLPGAQGFHPNPETWYLNPSYLPPPVLEYFWRRDPTSPWGQVMVSLPVLVGRTGGFAMDWLRADPTGLHPSLPPSQAQDDAAMHNSAAMPVGSYDAIRVYLWLGMSEPSMPGVKPAVKALAGMGAYLNVHNAPPLRVDGTGTVVNPDGSPGYSAAVLPFLHAAGMKQAEKTQADRLAATFDAKSGLYGRDGMYYDQNLALFATGFQEQRFRFEADGKLHVRWKT